MPLIGHWRPAKLILSAFALSAHPCFRGLHLLFWCCGLAGKHIGEGLLGLHTEQMRDEGRKAVPALENPVSGHSKFAIPVSLSRYLSLHLYFSGLVGGKARREQERPLQSRVLGTHFPWQLMMKHAVWMAFQHRRERAGFAPAVAQSGGEVALDAAEPDSGSEDARGDGQQDADDCDESQGRVESDQEAPRAGPHARAYVLACIMPCSGLRRSEYWRIHCQSPGHVYVCY